MAYAVALICISLLTHKGGHLLYVLAGHLDILFCEVPIQDFIFAHVFCLIRQLMLFLN